MKQHLHMSIGPVQDFIAQSRRTRDLWGSSYLLSFLSAHAMSGARREKGTIIRPHVDSDPLLDWVENRREGEPPRLGSLPNRFTVEIQVGADAGKVAKAAEESLRAAWRRVCKAVWDRYVAPAVAAGDGTDAIWKRQTEGFWEVTWVLGIADDRGLARRKLWQTHWLPEEAGDKCTVMHDLQELSGHVRATNRVRQDTFWAALRTRTGELDLLDNERLCAVSLVKRLYPRVADSALGWDVDVTRWPSTVDVAAVPWAVRVGDTASHDGDEFAVAVSKATDHAFTGGVSTLLAQGSTTPSQFLRLDANWFHRSFVSSPKLAPLSDEGARAALLSRLDALTSVPGVPPSPSIYFALLLADGDQLGELVTSLGSDTVSSALAKFTDAVPGLVSQHRGVTIYAGGDDVLALLPLEDALDCASDIEKAYRKSFGSISATLSAAIVFSHARDPLNGIVTEAHRLLDDIAKQQNGRASLAASVYRGGATAIQWVSAWERLSPEGRRKDAVECLNSLIRELASESREVSGSLLQDLRHMLGLLCGSGSLAPGRFAEVTEGIDLGALVRAEVDHRLSHRDKISPTDNVERLVSLVGELLNRSRRSDAAPRQVGIDALLLASFLAGGGHEEEHRS